jgi:hypothetical protein
MMGQGNLRVPCVLLFSGRLEVRTCGSSGPFLCPPIPLPLPEMTRLNHTHDWAKAGIMIRESLNANSRNAFVMVAPSNNSQGCSPRRRASAP